MIIEHLSLKPQLALLSYFAKPMAFDGPPTTTSVPVAPGEVVTLTLKGDTRVRWHDHPEASGPWIDRKARPWIKVAKVKGGYAAALTSEGARRLYMLKSCAEATGAPLPRSDA